jgi:hypothetical protein
MSSAPATQFVGHWLVMLGAVDRPLRSPENPPMNRALMVWKLKLCLAAVAAILAFPIAPQRPAHEQQAKDKNTKHQIVVNNHMVVDSQKPKAPAPAPARQPAATDSRDQLSAIL